MGSLAADNTFVTTAVHRSPIADSSVWIRTGFKSQQDWSYDLSSETLRELESTAQATLQSSGERPEAENLFLPAWADASAKLLAELKQGRGFVVLRGISAQRSDAELQIIYQLICTSLGTVLAQNAKGDRFYPVRDQGYDRQDFLANSGKLRAAETRSTLSLHTDSAPGYRGITPDIFALLTLQSAKSGGETLLISAATIHNILLEEYPEHLARLYQPYYFDRRVETLARESQTIFAPVFTYQNRLKMRYSLERIQDGYKVAGVPFTAEDKEALDCIEKVAQRENSVVAFTLERGEILLANNHLVLHSRTAFEDHPEPERKRHLVRAWLGFKQASNLNKTLI